MTTRVILPGEALRDGPTALRPWRESDVHAIVAACQDPEIPRWTSVPSPYGESDARAFLLARYGLIEGAAAAPFAIVEAPDGALLGSIGLMDLDWRHARGEVGYWLAREARGSGHATRALMLIAAWGFETLGLERIQLLAAVANRASQRVAERAGFTLEALLRSYISDATGRQDMVSFALLATDLGAA